MDRRIAVTTKNHQKMISLLSCPTLKREERHRHPIRKPVGGRSRENTTPAANESFATRLLRANGVHVGIVGRFIRIAKVVPRSIAQHVILPTAARGIDPRRAKCTRVISPA